MITFIGGFGAVFGSAEGIRASQSKSRREEHRSRKQNLVVHCPKGSQYTPTLEGRQIVLSGGRVCCRFSRCICLGRWLASSSNTTDHC
jgi:hypothetical protein